jgi:hypothetical protein
MAQSLTDWLQESRLTVVSVDPGTHRVRLRGATDACTDLGCSRDTVVVADDDAAPTLASLNPGDIVRVESAPSGPQRIVVLRRVWEELTSPEL